MQFASMLIHTKRMIILVIEPSQMIIIMEPYRALIHKYAFTPEHEASHGERPIVTFLNVLISQVQNLFR